MKRFKLDRTFVRNYFLFAVMLIGSATGLFYVILSNTQEFNELFAQVAQSFVQEDYDFARQHLITLKENRERYSATLLIGLIVSTGLILILNAMILSTQRRRSIAEASFKSSEERFKLAVNGTQDGIFDWDVETKEAFYSKRYFKMLGYDRPTKGTIGDFLELVHPEDRDAVWAYKESYINGKLSEYEQDYRMQHASGRWVWIKARATGVFDKKTNRAVRLVGAHTDITSTKMVEKQLEHEIEAAEESNRAKSEFLAHMSHEIRTPLTAISGAAEILDLQKEGFNEKQAQLVRVLRTSSSALKDLINSILDFSKIESSGLELDEHTFALDQVFQETISMMALKANEKNIKFEVNDKAIKDLEFYGDSTRIRQILVNIIGNAIKFTDKGSVKVSVKKQKKGDYAFINISVKDTGIGIPAEKHELVFEPFKQGDASVVRKHGGTGLGLPISRKLARLMGGDVTLQSKPGKGTTFSINLPLKDLKDKGQQRDEHDVLRLNEAIRKNLTQNSKVLVAEDYEGNVVVIGQMLENLGLEYDIAKDGAQALELWNKHHYDMVLMDVQMPEVDGFTATQRIREKESRNDMKRTPIVGMTAHALVGDKKKCIKVGMDAYLPKPLDESELKKQILKYIKSAAA